MEFEDQKCELFAGGEKRAPQVSVCGDRYGMPLTISWNLHMDAVAPSRYFHARGSAVSFAPFCQYWLNFGPPLDSGLEGVAYQKIPLYGILLPRQG